MSAQRNIFFKYFLQLVKIMDAEPTDTEGQLHFSKNLINELTFTDI